MKFTVVKLGLNFGPRLFKAHHCQIRTAGETLPTATVLLNHWWNYSRAFIRTFFARIPSRSVNVSKAGQVVKHTVIERPGGQPTVWKDVFSRVVSKCCSDSWAARLRRNTAKRLMFGTSNSFALLGFALAKEPTLLTQKQELDVICHEIREAFQNQATKDLSVSFEGPVSLAHLDIGSMFAKGCNAAVFSASWKPGVVVVESEESNGNAEALSGSYGPLAVKMMFNYTAESNAASILKAMYKESIPARAGSFGPIKNLISNEFRLPPHPNIVEMICAFSDYVPDLPEGPQLFPVALPPRLHEQGLGRNMTYFIVMRRYDCSLREYLKTYKPVSRTSMLLMTQMMEGLLFLHSQQVVHRDLKTDNILLDLSYGEASPQLVITDFGCCLAERTFKVPFFSDDTSRGGNLALMAPEVITAQPGYGSFINYDKSDVWAAGTIAYEIFGGRNPFYKEMPSHLENFSYSEKDLPPLPAVAPQPVQKIVKAMLARNPQERLSTVEVADMCQLLLHVPDGLPIRPQEVLLWLVALAGLSFYHQSEPEDAVEQQLRSLFLSRVQLQPILNALQFIHH